MVSLVMVAGSIFETVPSSALAVQTKPPPTSTSSGLRATGTGAPAIVPTAPEGTRVSTAITAATSTRAAAGSPSVSQGERRLRGTGSGTGGWMPAVW